MRNIEQSGKKKKGNGGRKALTVFGIIFIVAGVFFASLACSFQILIQAAQSQPDEGTLERENQKLREANQLLQDRIEILESEIEGSVPPPQPDPTATSSSSASPTATTRATARPTATATATSRPTATAPANRTAAPVTTPKPSSGNTLVE
jgi:cytoskeletal protein RodZ